MLTVESWVSPRLENGTPLEWCVLLDMADVSPVQKGQQTFIYLLLMDTKIVVPQVFLCTVLQMVGLDFPLVVFAAVF